MNMLYETDRLRLEILTPSSAREVLDFQLRNRELFARYEPSLPENFYTTSHQQALLKCELKLAMKLSTIRFYVFRKDAPSQIIGTVCLHDVTRMPYSCCEIGYKFDRAVHRRGYAREAVAKAVSIAFLILVPPCFCEGCPVKTLPPSVFWNPCVYAGGLRALLHVYSGRLD